jgi:ATP-dependent helicase Lhr and Lhr-like helicase
LDLGIEVPPMPLGPVASNELWDAIYDRLVALVSEHRSTLVFVNTRRMAERLCHELGERMGEENVAAHHGVLSRKLRLAAEKKLKEGQVRVLVATASLELGIDVGTVDLVVQINSPRAIAVALQRVGRSGHWRGAVPKGRFFVTTRDDLMEVRGAGAGDQAGRPGSADYSGAPLDVLAQQIVWRGRCGAGGARVRRALRRRLRIAWDEDFACAADSRAGAGEATRIPIATSESEARDF